MPFSDDSGGFAFSCNDAKFSVNASTWNTKLSQIGKMNGAIRIMTRLLSDTEYIFQILSKRPNDIFILAHADAVQNARIIKDRFPNVRIALHPKMNSKVAFIAPETVWVCSADFGKSKNVESAIGIHSQTVHDRGLITFEREWRNASEL